MMMIYNITLIIIKININKINVTYFMNVFKINLSYKDYT